MPNNPWHASTPYVVPRHGGGLATGGRTGADLLAVEAAEGGSADSDGDDAGEDVAPGDSVSQIGGRGRHPASRLRAGRGRGQGSADQLFAQRSRAASSRAVPAGARGRQIKHVAAAKGAKRRASTGTVVSGAPTSAAAKRRSSGSCAVCEKTAKDCHGVDDQTHSHPDGTAIPACSNCAAWAEKSLPGVPMGVVVTVGAEVHEQLQLQAVQ
eukprot:5327087-Pyramimonas_sp.AAC.1